MKVAVVIPARNEEEVIGKMLSLLIAVYDKIISQIVVVNDGSHDRTAGIVSQAARGDRRIKLINRRPPHGVGFALREGLTHVTPQADYILTIDADFIRNIPDLTDFFSHIGKYDGLIGSRYKDPYSLIRYPFFKKVANRAFHWLVRFFLGVKHSDLTNNFKLYRKQVFDNLALTAGDYAVNAETGLYPILMGYNIGELPVTWFARDRSMGRSKFKLLSVAPGYARILLRASVMSKHPWARLLQPLYLLMTANS